MDSFIAVIDDFIEVIDKLITLNKEKIEVAKVNDIFSMDEIIKQEQAISLKLKGIEKKRESVQTELGFENMTFSQIIGDVRGEVKEILNAKYSLLTDKVIQLKKEQDLSQDYIKLNLYKIEKQMENFRQSFKQKNFRKVKVGDKRKIEKRT